MEKYRGQRRNLHIVFIAFTKTFDSVNGDMLSSSWDRSVALLNLFASSKTCILIPMRESLLMGSFPIP